MNKSSLHTNQQWLNNLRVTATFSVILLHVAAPFLYQYHKIPLSSWWSAHVYDSLTRFCVPVFVMITGTLLLAKELPFQQYIRKRFTRICYPFLFWISIYLLHACWRNQNNFTKLFTDFTNLKTSKIFLQTSYHFWYIYMILLIYLTIPLIWKLLRKANNSAFLYFLICWLVSIYIIQPFIPKSWPFLPMLNNLNFVGYIVLGYYLSVLNTSKIKHIKTYAISVFFLGFVITLFGTYILTKQNGVFNSYFYQYFSPGVVLTAIGIFLYFKHQNIPSKIINKPIDFINKHSFGVYFVHIIVLFYLNRYGFNYAIINPVIGIPITSILCLGISLLIIFILNQIGLKKLVN